MELVTLTYENLDTEHICCAISNNRDIQVMSKKNWLKDRLDEGLVFMVNGLDFQSTEYLYQQISGYKEYGTVLFSLPCRVRSCLCCWSGFIPSGAGKLKATCGTIHGNMWFRW